MRLIHLLHGGRELNCRFTAAQIFDAAIHIGAKVLNAPASQDFVVIDYDALTADSLFDDIDEAEVLLTGMTSAQAKGLFVGGREIMRDGRMTTVDFDGARRELLEQARADLPRLRRERQLAGSLSAAIRSYYSRW
jgi:cytosine/adenosine deaminase-related metal-dependent hydrolase